MGRLVTGLLFNNSVSIRAINSTDMVEKARCTHGLSPVCCAALGRTISACALISSKYKEKWYKMSATIKGDGPIGNIVVCADGTGKVKGLVGNPKVDLPLNEFGKLDVSGAVGFGTLTVINDIGLKDPYIGTVELQSGEIGDDFAYYLLTSEQTPTLVYLGVLVDKDCSIKSSGGIIVEPLPECEDSVIDILEQNAFEIAKFNRMMAEGKDMVDALKEIFDGMDLHIKEELSHKYECDCSRERMAEVIAAIPKSDLKEIIEEDKKAQLVCHFCHKEYNFTEEELEDLL